MKTLGVTYFTHVFQILRQLVETIDSQCDINFSMLILTNRFFELAIHYSEYSSHRHVLQTFQHEYMSQHYNSYLQLQLQKTVGYFFVKDGLNVFL